MAKRIAIVEDEAAIRDNYAAAFEREGYLVDAYDAREPAMHMISCFPEVRNGKTLVTDGPSPSSEPI